MSFIQKIHTPKWFKSYLAKLADSRKVQAFSFMMAVAAIGTAVIVFPKALQYPNYNYVKINGNPIGVIGVRNNATNSVTTNVLVAATDGGVFALPDGSTGFMGSAAGAQRNDFIAFAGQTTAAGDTNGYFLATKDGQVYGYGLARPYYINGAFGSLPEWRMANPGQPVCPDGLADVVDMASADGVTGYGYIMVAKCGIAYVWSDGGFKGAVSCNALLRTIAGNYCPPEGEYNDFVAVAMTPDAQGYCLVRSGGAVYCFGSAGYFGGANNLALNKPIVDIKFTFDTSGRQAGYLLFAGDGGVFAYGNAQFSGSLPGLKDTNGNAISLAAPVVAGEQINNNGYWMVAADGGVFALGSAQFPGRVDSACPAGQVGSWPNCTAVTIPAAPVGPTTSVIYVYGPKYTSTEWSMSPLQDAPASLTTDGLLHYYYNWFELINSTSKTGGGYAGFQTNNSFGGIPRGKAINFSIWGSTNAKSPSALINPTNAECGCYQIVLPYQWQVGRKYSFVLKTGPSGTSSNSKWWGLWVTDTTSHKTTFVGEQKLPLTISGKDSSSLKNQTIVVAEDTHWGRSQSGQKAYKCSDFQASLMAITGLTMNGNIKPFNILAITLRVRPSAEAVTPNQIITDAAGFQTKTCNAPYYSDTNSSLEFGLGYWPTPPKNYLPSLSH